MAKELDYGSEMAKRQSDPHYPDFYAASNEQAEIEEYDGMLLQAEDCFPGTTCNHSPFFYARENEVNSEVAEEEAAKEAQEKQRAEDAVANGEPLDEDGQALPEKHYKNTSLDYEEVWDGSILLQLGDHVNDDDDIVPELNENVQVKKIVDTGAPIHK